MLSADVVAAARAATSATAMVAGKVAKQVVAPEVPVQPSGYLAVEATVGVAVKAVVAAHHPRTGRPREDN